MRSRGSMWIAALALAAALPARAEPGWMDPAWKSRAAVAIANRGATLLEGFQVRVALGEFFDFGRARTDGGDLRVTAGDGVTRIPFWVERWDAEGRSAALWVKVPQLPPGGATVFLYYDNPSATSASDGRATFVAFEDFEDFTSGERLGYFALGPPSTVLVKDQAWETSSPHTLSVVEANAGGHRYWGWYGLQAGCEGVGLAFSDDLVTWTKHAGNPILRNGRWASVLEVDGTFYMLRTVNCFDPSYIVLAASTDGIHFSDVKTIVAPDPGRYNHNPDLFRDPVDGRFWIYWYEGYATSGAPGWTIRARSATAIEGLDDPSSESTVLSSSEILAAPDVLFLDGTYFLATEVYGTAWETRVYASTSPSRGFWPLPGNPVLSGGSACTFQHVFDGVLHAYSCKYDGKTWTVEHRSADLGAGRLGFGSVPAGWTASGGEWAVVDAEQRDGSQGGVLRARISQASDVLLSSYQGRDYVVEAFGAQRSGRVWGLAVGANLCTANLYADPSLSDNLDVYEWVNGKSTLLASAPSGSVEANAWSRLTVKVHGTSLDVYLDGDPMIQATASRNASGAFALRGERDTVADFDDVFVRAYAAIEPTATLLGGDPTLVVAGPVRPHGGCASAPAGGAAGLALALVVGVAVRGLRRRAR